MSRRSRLAELKRLDPEVDYERIHAISSDDEFGWETRRALELALFHGFAVPSISAVLDRSGEFAHHGQKRYDDTVLMLREVAKDGLESTRGRAAIRRLNGIHHAHDVPNDDYLYTLATFVVLPIRWIERYGWRALSDTEIRAAVNYYRRLGQLMGIRELPRTYAEFCRFLDAYERDRHAFAETNRRVALQAIAVFERWHPWALRRLVRKVVIAALDESLPPALGLPQPSTALRALVHSWLRARALVVGVRPQRSGADEKHALEIRTYPAGYELADLGPTDREQRATGSAKLAP